MKWKRPSVTMGCRTNLVPRTVIAWNDTLKDWGKKIIIDHEEEHEFSHYIGWCFCGRRVKR